MEAFPYEVAQNKTPTSPYEKWGLGI